MRIVVAFYLYGFCVAASRMLSRRVHSSIVRSSTNQYRCIGLIGENDDETARLRRECRVTMQTEFMRKSWSLLWQASRKQLHEARLRYSEGKSRAQRSVSSCPTLSAKFMADKQGYIERANLSPYTRDLDYDPLRYPRYIMQKRCLCDGCISPDTRKETFFFNGMPVYSKAVRSEIRVWYRDNVETDVYSRPGIAIVSIGCHCMIAN